MASDIFGFVEIKKGDSWYAVTDISNILIPSPEIQDEILKEEIDTQEVDFSMKLINHPVPQRNIRITDGNNFIHRVSNFDSEIDQEILESWIFLKDLVEKFQDEYEDVRICSWTDYDF